MTGAEPRLAGERLARGATARVPGSTSNLGGGFDCVGVAVDRWLIVHARPLEASTPPPGREAPPEPDPSARPDGALPGLERHGTLAEIAEAPGQDLVLAGFAAACRSAGREPPREVAFEATSDIPVGRGLGSSAAALVAGAALADYLLELGLDDQRLAELCAGLEGHPDNVAPCVFGGAMLALMSPGGELALSRLEVHGSLALVFAVPEFAVSTKRARAVLPETVPHATAVAAAARGAALVLGLAHADEALLAAAFQDVLHVPFRRELVPGFDAVCAAASAAGAFGATLSGSGSSVVAVAPRERAAAVGEAMRAAWSDTAVGAEWFVSAGQVPGVSVSTSLSPREPAARRAVP